MPGKLCWCGSTWSPEHEVAAKKAAPEGLMPNLLHLAHAPVDQESDATQREIGKILQSMCPQSDTVRIWGRIPEATETWDQAGNAWACNPNDLAAIIAGTLRAQGFVIWAPR